MSGMGCMTCRCEVWSEDQAVNDNNCQHLLCICAGLMNQMALTTGLRHAIRSFSLAVARRSFCAGPQKVLTETRDDIFMITINRPEKRNCVDRETADLLRDAFLRFESDSSLRVAILSGSGGNFCAGYDLSEISAIDSIEKGASLLRPAPMGPSHLSLSKPVIAAVDGYAVAGGLELALFCDMRVAEENAVFGVYCRRYGVPLIDGGTVRLPAVVGLGRAMDMILTGRPVTGREAYEMGLVNQLAQIGTVLGAASKLAYLIAKFPFECVKADRRSVYNSVFDAKSQKEALDFEYENGKRVLWEESVPGAQDFVLKGLGRHGKANFRPSKDTASRTPIDSSLLD